MKIRVLIIFGILFLTAFAWAETKQEMIISGSKLFSLQNSLNRSDQIGSFLTFEKLIEISYDRQNLHEARPQGVPAGYDWAKGPRLGAGNYPGTKYNAITGWGQIFWAWGAKDNQTTVHARNLHTYICYGAEHKWMLLQQGDIEGRQFRADFVNNKSTGANYFEQVGGIATIKFEKGSAFHFWPRQGQVRLPSKHICGVLVLLEARAVGEGSEEVNPNAFLIGLGADYWTERNSKWDNYKTNTDIAIGRLRFVGADWSWFGMTTASEDDLESLYQKGFEH